MLALALALAFLALAPLGAAAERIEERTYEAAAMVVTLGQIPDPVGVARDGYLNVGGVSFPTLAGDTLVQLVVRDEVKAALDPAGATSIAAEACQDLDGDNACDVSRVFCGTTTLALTGAPGDFQPGRPLVVFIFATEVNTPLVLFKPCPGPVQRAYTGTVTATFA